MRKIIYGINLTADGCCDHTQLSGSAQTHVYFTDLMEGVDLIVYGRKTYELMVPYWPEVAKSKTGEITKVKFAEVFDSIEKVVCSRTFDYFDGNPRIISENLKEEMLKLKKQPGGNISIGGIELPGQLIALGLVDEFYFLIHPVLSGKGRRLLDGASLQEQFKLELVDSKILESGCIALHYVKQ
ncbi:MAG: dihydrofolate reductase family protein [Bacteroidota bacterium]